MDWNVTVHSSDRLLTLPNVISGLEVQSNTCNDANLTDFNLSRFLNMRDILIGSKSLKNVAELSLSNMPKLHSFISEFDSLPKSNSFIATNNPMLENVEIGDKSFQSSSTFSLGGLSSLTALYVGSNCFQGDDNDSQSQPQPSTNSTSSSLQFMLNGFNQLSDVVLSSDSFTHFKTFEVSGRRCNVILLLLFLLIMKLLKINITNTNRIITRLLPVGHSGNW